MIRRIPGPLGKILPAGMCSARHQARMRERRQHDMKNKKYSIVYSSLTGNTKVLADAIHEALPQDECE